MREEVGDSTWTAALCSVPSGPRKSLEPLRVHLVSPVGSVSSEIETQTFLSPSLRLTYIWLYLFSEVVFYHVCIKCCLGSRA